MRNRYKILTLVAVFVFGISAKVVNDKYFEITKNIEIFVNTYKELNANYVDDIDPSELMRIGIDAMVTSLDPYTNFISESQVESYRITTEGTYQGVGAIIKKIDDYVTVLEPYEGSPALEAGLRAGDQIIKVNGLSTKGKSNEEVNAIVRGVPGTALDLTVKRPGEKDEIEINLVRGEVSMANVPYSGIVSDNVGYIALTTFTPMAGKNVRKALKKLKEEDPELKGVILDLRFNGGGLLREAIEVSNVFIPKGEEVVTTKGKVRDRDQTFKTGKTPEDLEIPVVVLINKRSASASEIVSGVIQDLDRGVIMGQRSFGKGLVQNTKETGYNSKVKLTTSKYYIPSRRCIQSVEYENGEPKDIPDERRSKFKTRNGRTVLDGGGVTPDVRIEPEEKIEFVEALKNKNIIFKYINEYVLAHDSIVPAGEYVFDDYEGFKDFAKKSDFGFTSKSEKLIEKLQESVKDNKEGLDISTEVEALLSQIEDGKQDDFEQYRNILQRELENEIVARYYYQSGKAQQRLRNDNEINEAIGLILDEARYNEILSGS